MNYAKTLFVIFSLCNSVMLYPQGVGIPSSRSGFGFGNLRTFSGIRFNFIDKRVSKISGINGTMWKAKADSLQRGTVTGISLGLPLAMGTEVKKGIGLAIFGVGATKNLTGINIAGLCVRSGGTFKGISVSTISRVNEHHGITIAIVNYCRKIRGIQIGVINIVKENPKGLRVLPILNMRFGKKSVKV